MSARAGERIFLPAVFVEFTELLADPIIHYRRSQN